MEMDVKGLLMAIGPEPRIHFCHSCRVKHSGECAPVAAIDTAHDKLVRAMFDLDALILEQAFISPLGWEVKGSQYHYVPPFGHFNEAFWDLS